jgi:hypothetical protein
MTSFHVFFVRLECTVQIEAITTITEWGYTAQEDRDINV